MKFDYLKNREKIISGLLLLLSAIFAILIFIRIGDYFLTAAKAKQIVKDVIAKSQADSNQIDKYFAENRKIAARLEQENLFIPPQPKQNPANNLIGILGDEALINGRWYKVGDTIGDAKILEIQSTFVKVMWDGKEHILEPFKAQIAGEPAKGSPAGKAGRRGRKVPPAAAFTAAPSVGDPLAWLGIPIPESVRAKFLEHWNSMPDEEKQKTKEQWNNMSDEEKQQAAKAWENM